MNFISYRTPFIQPKNIHYCISVCSDDLSKEFHFRDRDILVCSMTVSYRIYRTSWGHISREKYKNIVQEQAIFQNLRYIWFSIIGQLLSSQHRLVYLSSVWLFTSQHRINSTFSLNLYCAFFHTKWRQFFISWKIYDCMEADKIMNEVHKDQ